MKRRGFLSAIAALAMAPLASRTASDTSPQKARVRKVHWSMSGRVEIKSSTTATVMTETFNVDPYAVLEETAHDGVRQMAVQLSQGTLGQREIAGSVTARLVKDIVAWEAGGPWPQRSRYLLVDGYMTLNEARSLECKKLNQT